MTIPQTPGSAQPLEDQLGAVLRQMPDPSGGPLAAELERELAEAFGVAHVVAVASGTAALHAALAACGIGPGDEVLVPALTVVMTVAPLNALGATPVFVDSDPATLDLDYDDAARKVTSRTRAIIPVYLWGRMGDPAALASFASEHGLAVVEDAAQAVGTTRDGQRAGTVGTVGCFSMKDGKILWSGEGGFLLTARREVAEYARAFRSHWLLAPPGEAPLSRLATNSRLAAPLAAIALANLRRISHLVELRQEQTRHLLHALEQTPGLVALSSTAGEEWNGFAPLLHIDLPNPRAFAEHVAQQGVPSSTGRFRLMPCDTRPMFTSPDRPCRGAAQILDHTLAVVLTERDTETTLDRYAAVIAREATAWARDRRPGTSTDKSLRNDPPGSVLSLSPNGFCRMTITPVRHFCTRGPLISAEGINGVGKTYLTKRAIEDLGDKPLMLDGFSQRANGHPGLGKALLRSLREASAGDPFLRGGAPIAEALILLAIKRHDLDTVVPELASGRAVVEGRSVDTTAVCQALLLHPDNPDAALQTATALLDLASSYRPLPDLTILVTDDAAQAVVRAQRRDRCVITTEQATFMRDAAALYERVAATYPTRYRVVDRRSVGEHEAAEQIRAWIHGARTDLGCLREPWQCPGARCICCGQRADSAPA